MSLVDSLMRRKLNYFNFVDLSMFIIYHYIKNVNSHFIFIQILLYIVFT